MHKQCGCQTAVLNLPACERFEEKNILLPVLARASTYKKHGMARVLCGVDADGVEHDEPNYGRDMRELDVGRWITIPDDRDNLGNTRHVRLRGWNVAISCDYLGKQSVLPFMESSRAHRCVPLNPPNKC